MRVLIVLVVLLAGCASQQLQGERQAVAGQPVAYQDGYVAGCSSGYKAAGNPYFAFQKDLTRMADQLYGQGWGDGFAVCKGKYDSITRMLR